jgi:hypothetical protein
MEFRIIGTLTACDMKYNLRGKTLHFRHDGKVKLMQVL